MAAAPATSPFWKSPYMCCAKARYGPILELSTPLLCATFLSWATATGVPLPCRNASPRRRSAGGILWFDPLIISPCSCADIAFWTRMDLTDFLCPFLPQVFSRRSLLLGSSVSKEASVPRVCILLLACTSPRLDPVHCSV